MPVQQDYAHLLKHGRVSMEENRADTIHASQLLDLPDTVLQQHLLPLLAGCDKKALRCAAAHAGSTLCHRLRVAGGRPHRDHSCPPPAAALADPNLGCCCCVLRCRLASARPRQLINQCVEAVVVPASALQEAVPAFKLGMPFQAARSLKVGCCRYYWLGMNTAGSYLCRQRVETVSSHLLTVTSAGVCLLFAATQAYDVGDASITDAALIKFLSASGPWLEQLQSVDFKYCHYVTGDLLAFLRSACPKLSKLSPSRWIDNAAMAEMAFPSLQVCHCCHVVSLQRQQQQPASVAASVVRQRAPSDKAGAGQQPGSVFAAGAQRSQAQCTL